MKVAVLTTSFPRWAGDFFGNYIYYVAREHACLGADVSVVAPHAPASKGRERLEGVEVLRFRYAYLASNETLAYGGGVFGRLRSSWAARLLLPAFVASFLLRAAPAVRRCDVVHAHWTLAGVVGLVLAKVFRKRLVLTVYGIEVFTGRFGALTRMCVRGADHVICISSATAERTRELAGGLPETRLSVIPYGVPKEFIEAPHAAVDVRQRHGLPEDAPVVLTVGRLIERKGIEYLLQALRDVRQRIDARAIIVGDGPERARLERLAGELGMTDAVTFAGAAASDELVAYYDACEVFAHPVITDPTGDVEGLGLVLLEAMARGRPVIASRAGGITDVVVDGNSGLLVPERDTAALAEGLERLMMDRELAERLSSAGRRRVIEEFSVPALSARVMDVYERVLATR